MNLPQGPISIPKAFRSVAVRDWDFPEQLLRVLDRLGVKVFGDLERYRYEDLTPGWRANASCLCRVVSLLWCEATGEIPTDFSKGRVMPAAIYVPESVRGLSLESTTLRWYLWDVENSHERNFGDLHGLTEQELRSWPWTPWLGEMWTGRAEGLEREVWKVLVKVVTRECDPAVDAECAAAVRLSELIESGLAMLSPLRREVLLAYVSDEKGALPTMAELARRVKRSTTRTNAIIGDTRVYLLLYWEGRVEKLLQRLKEDDLPPVCPLTVPLLAQWARKEGVEFPRPLVVYLRVIGILSGTLHCWTDEGDGTPLPKKGRKPFETWLVKRLSDAGPAPIAKIFAEMEEDPGWDGMDADLFLSELVKARGVEFDFQDPEAPVVRLMGS